MASQLRVACLALALMFSCGRAASSDPDAAPTLTGKELDGDYWSSTDALGKVTLVNVWATWCEPCRRELPALQATHERLAGPDFELVGISVDADADAERVRQMVSRRGLSYRIVLDPSKRVNAAWGVSSYPTSVLLDRRGHELWRRQGALTRDDPELIAQIDAALTN